MWVPIWVWDSGATDDDGHGQASHHGSTARGPRPVAAVVMGADPTAALPSRAMHGRASRHGKAARSRDHARLLAPPCGRSGAVSMGEVEEEVRRRGTHYKEHKRHMRA
jgi:hypothetical protein